MTRLTDDRWASPCPFRTHTQTHTFQQPGMLLSVFVEHFHPRSRTQCIIITQTCARTHSTEQDTWTLTNLHNLLGSSAAAWPHSQYTKQHTSQQQLSLAVAKFEITMLKFRCWAIWCSRAQLLTVTRNRAKIVGHSDG